MPPDFDPHTEDPHVADPHVIDPHVGGNAGASSALLDPGELKPSMVRGIDLEFSLVTPVYVNGPATTAAELKPALTDAAGNLKPSLLNSEGDLKPSLTP